MLRIFSFSLLVIPLSLALHRLAFSAPTQDKPKPPALVFVETAKKTDLFETLSYPARIQPKVNANVLADTDGVLTQILVPIGKSVQRGALLATVKNTDPIYDYAPAQITAPVKGVVSSIETSIGSRINRGQKLMTITDPTRYSLFIEVAQNDLKFLTGGVIGDFSQSGSSDTFKIKIAGVSPFVDPITGTATAELVPENPAQLVPVAGALGQVHFKVNQKKGFQLPETAITYRGQAPFIRIVDKGIAKFLAVELGPLRRGNIEILKGLEEGFEIILRSGQFLSDGDAVTVQKPEGTKS